MQWGDQQGRGLSEGRDPRGDGPCDWEEGSNFGHSQCRSPGRKGMAWREASHSFRKCWFGVTPWPTPELLPGLHTGDQEWVFWGTPRSRWGREVTFLRLGQRCLQLPHVALGSGTLPLHLPQTAAQVANLGATVVLGEGQRSAGRAEGSGELEVLGVWWAL